MANILFALMIVLFTLAAVPHEAACGGQVRVILEYKSMFPGTIQVVDKVCSRLKNVECTRASIKINSESCLKDPTAGECREASDLLATSFCMDGLVYEGRIGSGEKITVNLCESAGGYGNMSVRNIDKGEVWTNFPLLSDGQTVSYP